MPKTIVFVKANETDDAADGVVVGAVVILLGVPCMCGVGDADRDDRNGDRDADGSIADGSIEDD